MNVRPVLFNAIYVAPLVLHEIVVVCKFSSVTADVLFSFLLRPDSRNALRKMQRNTCFS